MSTYTARAAVIDRLLEELGDPTVTAITLWGSGGVDVQINEPIPGVDWTHETRPESVHWTADIQREDVRIRLSSCVRIESEQAA